jgi:hypothetical protein
VVAVVRGALLEVADALLVLLGPPTYVVVRAVLERLVCDWVVGAGPGVLQPDACAAAGLRAWNQMMPVAASSTAVTSRIGHRRRRRYRTAGESVVTLPG